LYSNLIILTESIFMDSGFRFYFGGYIMDREKLQEDFKVLCQKQGWKCTPQRFAVYEYIKGNQTHPDVNSIWEHLRPQMPSITRESVFRILNELADCNVICRMDKIINARFDGNATNHGHLICERCGKIIDLELPESITNFTPGGAFTIRHMELRLSGLCPKCTSETTSSDK